jgi:hypothetical protein
MRKLGWTGHVISTEEDRIPKKLLNRKFHNTRTVENPKTRWEDVFQRDELQILGTRGWRRQAGDREQWRRVLREARSQQRSNWMDGLFRKLEEQQIATIKCKPYVIQIQRTSCAITQTVRVTALSL